MYLRGEEWPCGAVHPLRLLVAFQAAKKLISQAKICKNDQTNRARPFCS